MFIKASNPTFTHVVKVKVPIDGGHADQDFKATFKVLPIDKSSEFDLREGASSTEFLRTVVIGMDGIVDDANQPVPYSDALRDEIVAIPYARAALVRTYFEAIGGAAAGN